MHFVACLVYKYKISIAAVATMDYVKNIYLFLDTLREGSLVIYKRLFRVPEDPP